MKKILSKLLDKSEDEIAEQITKLESATGYPSEDVRLLAENKQRLRVKMSQLGLDPDDTTDEELYQAVLARFERDSEMIDKAVGVNQFTSFDERLNKAIQITDHCASVDDAWVVKSSVIKSLLAKYPPKHVAKALRYRSVASLLKREEKATVILSAELLEPETWQKNMAKELSKLNSSSYELRPIKITKLPDIFKSTISEVIILSNKTMGALAVLPHAEIQNAPVLSLSLIILNGLFGLNPDGYRASLDELSPAMHWWADADFLVADGEPAISLNLHDVSNNYQRRNSMAESAANHGANSLWLELSSRYERLKQELVGKENEIESAIASRDGLGLPISSELAEEYAAAE